MLNTLARLSKSLLAFQKYHDLAAKSQAAQLKQLDVDRELSDREYDLLVKKMDQVFKVARRPKPDAAATKPPAQP